MEFKYLKNQLNGNNWSKTVRISTETGLGQSTYLGQVAWSGSLFSGSPDRMIGIKLNNVYTLKMVTMDSEWDLQHFSTLDCHISDIILVLLVFWKNICWWLAMCWRRKKHKR